MQSTLVSLKTSVQPIVSTSYGTERYQREQAVNNAITSLKAVNKATREAKEKEITEEYRDAENEAWNEYLFSSQTAYIMYATAYQNTKSDYKSAKQTADNEYISTVLVGWNTYSNKVNNLDALFESAVAQAGDSSFNPATFFNNGVNGNQGNVLLITNKKQQENTSQEEKEKEFLNQFSKELLNLGKGRDIFYIYQYLDGDISRERELIQYSIEHSYSWDNFWDTFTFSDMRKLRQENIKALTQTKIAIENSVEEIRKEILQHPELVDVLSKNHFYLFESHDGKSIGEVLNDKNLFLRVFTGNAYDNSTLKLEGNGLYPACDPISIGIDVLISGAGITIVKNAAASAVVSRAINNQGITHLTKPVAKGAIETSIANSQTTIKSLVGEKVLGGKWGIFGVNTSQIAETRLGKLMQTLVGGDLSAGVSIPAEALKYFKKPPLTGPFSTIRRIIGVRSTPLGSINLTTGEFLPSVILKNGKFVQANTWDKLRYIGHQGLLDYGIDSIIYVLGGSIIRLYGYTLSTYYHLDNQNE